MKRIIAATFAALTFTLTLASVHHADAQTGTPADLGFMIEAARGGLAEVELGRLAVQRGATDAVRQFGQRMVADHSAANQELLMLAQRRGVTLPQALDPSHRMLVDRLATLSGPQFDQAYMAEMVRDHRADAAAFEREVREGQDPEMRAWAARTLATVQHHQRIANDLHARIAQMPIAVVPVPSASPATTETITTVTTTVAPAPPFCGGVYRPDTGTNFGPCR